jgi:hypothetical protein
VDPPLLRSARLFLGLPVSAELDLRASPLVASGTAAGLTLAQEVLPVLRAELAADQAALETAWQLTRARHPYLSPALALEEELTWRALAEGSAAVGFADKQLNRVLVSIVRDGRTQLAAWAARALPRLPEAVRNVRSARFLAMSARAKGYRPNPSIRSAGPPPSWIEKPEPANLIGGVSLFGSRLEFNYPRRGGDELLQLPASRRVWISWWEGSKRRTVEAAVLQGRPVSVEIAGSEITVEWPGSPPQLIRDKLASPEQRHVVLRMLGRQPTPAQRDLLEYVRAHLVARGHNLAPETSSTDAPAGSGWDYYVFIRDGNASPQTWPYTGTLAQECRPVIVLNTGTLGIPTPAMGATEIDFSDRTAWDTGLQQLISQLAPRPAPAGALVGVPELGAVFIRREPLFQSVKTALLEASQAMVGMFGPPGSGRTSAAIDLVRDCDIRRRFPGGIIWSHDDHSWSTNRQHPYLAVLQDPYESDHPNAIRTASSLNADRSCILLLVPGPERLQGGWPMFDASQWSDADLLELFQRAAGPLPISVSLVNVHEFSSATPRGAVNLGRLTGSAVRAGADLGPAVAALSGSEPLAAARRRAVFEFELVAPFAAFPPERPVPRPSEPVWRRYFPQRLLPHVLEAWDIFVEAFPEGQMPAAMAAALDEIARETHQRVVDSYAAECGGDWANGPDDGYFVSHIAGHLQALGQERVRELTENLDWLIRANNEGAGWFAGLREPVRTASFNPAEIERNFADDSTSTGRMARGRIALRANSAPSRYILVVGTGKYELPPVVNSAATAIGRELARYGYGLIGGGWKGVDYVTAATHMHQLAFAGLPSESGLLQIVPPNFEPDFKGGIIVRVDSDPEAEEESVRRADAVIAIGGLGGTLRIAHLARKMDKPVFPLPGTGGDAAVLFGEMAGSRSEPLSRLDVPLDSPRSFYDLARAVVTLLPEPGGLHSFVGT